MASSMSKRQKSRGKGKHGVFTGAVGGEDRIGRLPNAMVFHILSFLETKYVIRTSVLSKWWRYVWTSVPCIDIQLDIRHFKGFIRFADKLLRLNTVPCLRRFCLSWGWGGGEFPFPKDFINEWVRTMMECDIEEIVIDIWGRGCQSVKFPPSIFTRKNLVILKLSRISFMDVPSSVYLPSLKILHIYLQEPFDDDSIKNLLDGCPIIEELNIEGKLPDCNVKTLVVRSSSLKRLMMNSEDLKIVVDVPNVERLDLLDYGSAQYDITNGLSSLVRLYIHIGPGSRLVELLRKFTNTEFMNISLGTTNSLEYGRLNDFPMFYNLTFLVVDILEPSHPILRYLLECSPNLVTYYYSSYKAGSREQHLQFKAPKCSMLYLKEIKVEGLKGFEYEMEMVRYFLKNAKVLKKLTIQSYADEKKRFEISRKLLTFARGSTDCEILFR